MSLADYLNGIRFIKETAGTPGEMKHRLKYWKREAWGLVGKELPTEKCA